MKSVVSEHFDDILVGVGIVILLSAVHLGLGGAAALAFLGVILLFAGVWSALIKNAERARRRREGG